MRLTDDEYWDRVWADYVDVPLPTARWKRFLTEVPTVRELWREMLPRFLPQAPARVLELGSAPGRNLLRWRNMFGYEVFGVDTSEEGLRCQRELLARHGIGADHTLEADCLDPAFQRAHEGSFDIAFSDGLIEHFTDPREVVAAHVRILRPGGVAVITVPNLLGIYRRLMPVEIVEAHNLEIMREASFRSLFEPFHLELLFCGYYGRLNFWVAWSKNLGLRRLIPEAQVIANLLMRLVPFPENRWTSPYLMCIARRL